MEDILELRAQLLGSLLTFTRVFYKIRTGREFFISMPTSQEAHVITICRALTKVFYLESNRLIINCPPGWGKSEIFRHFVAFCFAHYPDCQFIYISFGYERAEENTAYIKQIIELPAYRKLFGVEIDPSNSSKGKFKTTQGGTVCAFGSSGPVVGADAGLPNLDRFSGMVLIDDIHKPDDVHSDTMREGVIKNYDETIKQRPRGINVPIALIGQRLHEEDLPGVLLQGHDGYHWDRVILKAMDVHGNALYPEKDPREKLLIEKEHNPYVFSSQYMQDPQPAGGGIFKPEWFYLTEEEPEIFATFITADTAETDKNYNDATVFSFFGLYKTPETDQFALHWLDCREIRVEPKDLKPEFMDFYVSCCRFKIKPTLAGIEKKSSGVTLISLLKEIQGFQIKEIDRTRASGNKTARFLEIQPYVASKLISLPRMAKHTPLCLDHMKKITANNTHAHDDIADTLYDGIKIGLIDKYLTNYPHQLIKETNIINALINKTQRLKQARGY
ncbi:MAG: hypothetical protein A3E87_01670 [Gammaproteobacteria bacterium RIFCSPHIGHO2_12_FULL_35_23]|nr:MAG: hypothetical protein A3E87_01670 [Gammaproteobacteria bacterium RIFCSPHIGHO2_12_FULL_35_23]